MRFNQSGFLSAAVGVIVLVFFVGIVYLQRGVVQNTKISASPTPEPSAVVAEAKFTNNTKHLAVSPTPSPSASVKPSVLATASPNTQTPTPSPTSQSTPTPTPTPAGRFIKILSPNGGENYKIGDNINITWEYNDLAQCVIIYMLEDGTRSSLFIPVKPSQKSYQLGLLTDYLGMIEEVKVKVEMSCYSSDNNGAQDQSDNFFTIKK